MFVGKHFDFGHIIPLNASKRNNMTFKREKKGFDLGSKSDRNNFQIVLKVFSQLKKYPQYSKYGTYFVYNTFNLENPMSKSGQNGLFLKNLIQ